MIQMIKMDIGLAQKVEIFTMVSKMAAIVNQNSSKIKITVNN